ncbi:MAG: antirestriction protein ArdA [Prochlorococcaceae cyanobacterium]
MTATITRPAGIAAGLPDVGAYVACLAAYNSGRLHGAWVDLEVIDGDVDALQECIDWVLATSPEPGAEEWAMHDHAGLPDCLSRSEWPDLADLAAWGEALADLSRSEWEAFRFYCDDRGEICDVDDFRDAYQGRWDSGEDFAYQLAEDLGAVPESTAWPLTCIDWEAAWRELRIGGDYIDAAADGGGVHIFRTN